MSYSTAPKRDVLRTIHLDALITGKVYIMHDLQRNKSYEIEYIKYDYKDFHFKLKDPPKSTPPWESNKYEFLLKFYGTRYRVRYF